MKSKYKIEASFINEEDIVDLGNTYRFKQPIESPYHKGFFLIPHFTRYAMNLDGKLINVITGREINWSIQKHSDETVTGGYRVTNIYNDSGERKGVSRHRLKMIVFSKYDADISKLWVNHLDGVPGNDELSNLEWTTPGGNVKHAYDNNLHPNKVVEVDIWNWITDERARMPSIAAVSRYLNVNENTIRGRLNRGNGNRYPDGWRLKYVSEDWLDLKGKLGKYELSIPVKCRNIHKLDEILIFRSASEAMKHTGVGSTSIGKQCREKIFTPIDQWSFRYLEDDLPDYTQRHVDLFDKQSDNRYSDGIVVIDDQGEEVFFGTQREAAERFKLSPITVNKLARYNSERNGMYFNLFKIKQNNLPPEDESPLE